MSEAASVQPSFEELGTPLIETTFVVLDLETTGVDAERDRITEIGAVKVRGGEVLGELQTLIHPGRAVPPAVTALTGITDGMLAAAPPIGAVLPSLLQFLDGAVLVAHNAAFDLRFLRAAVARERGEDLSPTVVDTARLARRLVRDEVRDRRLGTLARLFASPIVPDHRALTDARATVDVLHGLIERAGAYGATTLEDLRDLARSTSERSYRRIDLVRDAPRAPGVYRFLDERGEVLYVGKATELRTRLRTYFGRDPRRKVEALVRETAQVRWEVTATVLEAEVREVRAIADTVPRYNRRSRDPGRATYVAITEERFPRLSVVRRPGRGHRRTVGPFPSRAGAVALVEALQEVLPVRTCTGRLRVAQDHPACVLKELGRCGAPCDGTEDPASYGAVIERLDASLDDPSWWLHELRDRMLALADEGRFERAGELRRRLHAAGRALAQLRRVESLRRAGALTLARTTTEGVEVVQLAAGRLLASARLDGPPPASVEALGAAARRTLPTTLPVVEPGGNDLEEAALLVAWAHRDGVVVLDGDGTYASPLPGGRILADTAAEALTVGRALRRDRARLRELASPARAPVPGKLRAVR